MTSSILSDCHATMEALRIKLVEAIHSKVGDDTLRGSRGFYILDPTTFSGVVNIEKVDRYGCHTDSMQISFSNMAVDDLYYILSNVNDNNWNRSVADQRRDMEV